MTADDFLTAVARAGRANGPALLFDAYYLGRLAQPVLAQVIGDVWSTAEFPQDAMPQQCWREMFRTAGFTVDGQPAEVPTEPVTLYRAAPYPLRRRWSWTADRSVAERFTVLRTRSEPSGVWVTVAPPESLLCVDNSRGEAEHVVDTRGLKITAASD